MLIVFMGKQSIVIIPSVESDNHSVWLLFFLSEVLGFCCVVCAFDLFRILLYGVGA